MLKYIQKWLHERKICSHSSCTAAFDRTPGAHCIEVKGLKIHRYCQAHAKILQAAGTKIVTEAEARRLTATPYG